MLSGTRNAPQAQALAFAREVKQAFASWRPAIEKKKKKKKKKKKISDALPQIADSSRRLGSCVVSLCIRHAVGRRAHYRIWIHHRLGRGAHAWSSLPVRKVHRTVRQRFASREGDPCWPASSRAGGSIWGHIAVASNGAEGEAR